MASGAWDAKQAMEVIMSLACPSLPKLLWLAGSPHSLEGDSDMQARRGLRHI